MLFLHIWNNLFLASDREKIGVAVTIYISIVEVLSSNLGRVISYTDRIFTVFLSFPKQMPGLYLDYITTSLFQIFSSSLFTSHPAVRRH
jgi:hypothetical protein